MVGPERAVDALLIGGGVAAARCARMLRRAGFAGTILLVGEEPVPPYNRPPLSKELLRDDAPDELVLAEPLAWYERRGVELLLGAPVARLDAGARLAELADGRRLRYGQCLLATGASPRRPDVPGADGVLLLRTLADARAMRRRALSGGHAVVVGGGFIGVEVSASLATLGMRVTLLCGGDLLWSGSLGRQVSEWAAARLSRAGVAVKFSAIATAIEDGGVTVEGERLEARVVVAGVGVEPRAELAIGAGLEVDDGILVDEGGAAGGPGIFAAGDVARVRGVQRVEHWHAAREAGERAALAMAGQPAPARRAPWIFSEFAGTTLDVHGDVSGAEEVSVTGSVQAFARDGKVVGLAVLDGAVAPDVARTFVEDRPRTARLHELAEAR